MLDTPGIVLSFDDYSKTWHEQLPLLESLAIKATFFITGEFVRERAKAEARLLPLIEAGHTLGVHTISHRRASEMWMREGHAWLESDVLDQARILGELSGRPIRCFAYPYGDHDDATDRILTSHFQVVRTFGKKPLFSSHQRLRRGGVTHATSIDNVQERGFLWYEEQLAEVKRQSKIWVVASHHFDDTRWGITPERLVHFAETAHRLSIPILTFDNFMA